MKMNLVTVTVTLNLLLSLVWSVGGQEIVTESLSNSEYDEQQEGSGLQGPELGSGEDALIKEGSGSNEQKIEELSNTEPQQSEDEPTNEESREGSTEDGSGGAEPLDGYGGVYTEESPIGAEPEAGSGLTDTEDGIGGAGTEESSGGDETEAGTGVADTGVDSERSSIGDDPDEGSGGSSEPYPKLSSVEADSHEGSGDNTNETDLGKGGDTDKEGSGKAGFKEGSGETDLDEAIPKEESVENQGEVNQTDNQNLQGSGEANPEEGSSEGSGDSEIEKSSTLNVMVEGSGDNSEQEGSGNDSEQALIELDSDSVVLVQHGGEINQPMAENVTRQCEVSEFGCCKDTDFPSHGPHQEGCCLQSEFGCCPDNVRAAAGPAQEGCGCDSSAFGCCPDGKKAQREGGKGCGCSATEFGCCPDQHTKAEGLNFEGCPCHTFDFGCCEDGVTKAEGPNKEGCNSCQTSEFGCCPDGFTLAAGENSEGCGCAGSEFGCCPDGETAADGQEFEGCESKPGEACFLKNDKGSCEDFSVRWYFDSKEGRCSRFWYGGCEGNSNRFLDAQSCEQACVNPPGSGRCYLPKVRGICEGNYERFYYDSTYKQCMSFSYGGCLGNYNNFESKLECGQACVRSDNLAICEQPEEAGPCTGNFTRWFYNEGTGECQTFEYGGCHGNQNRFMDKESCENSCLHKKITMETTNMCMQEILVGSCNQSLARWAFNPEMRKCQPFYYNGCDGNTNNFNTVEECESKCPDAFPPELEVVNKILNVEEGQDAVLEITAEGNPFPNIEWQHDSQPVQIGEKYSLREDRSLLISGVTLEDAGSWMVLADNGLGKVARKQISLSVYPSQIPIKVEIPLEEHTFETGSTIRLECKVEGFPIPTINWFKNNARLPRSRRIYVEDEKFLVIKNASPIDGGAYICRAYNENMQNQAVVDLTVLQGETPIQCIDQPRFANCKLIVRAKYCDKNENFARLCCESCVAAGQIAGPPAA